MILANHGIISSSGGVSFDADAQAFITAASISDSTQQTAINTLVTDLKTYNIWTKMKALYPFVGGTATTHKWNLKNPVDTNQAFRLVFYGGMTHSSLGVVSNYTTSYGNTFLTPSTDLSSLFSQHVSVYSQTSTATPSLPVNTVGEWYSSTQSLLMRIRNPSNQFTFETGNSSTIATNTDAIGMHIASVTANNSIKLYKNNSIIANNTTTFSGSLMPTTMPFAKRENKTFSFMSIGDGLSDTEVSNFYTAVQAYQTTLNRQV